MISRGHILLGDDDPAFRLATRTLLREAGYDCDEAISGDEVKQRLRAAEYDLLICDIDMPGNRDLELIRAIPLIRAHLPIILATGAPQVDTAVASVQLAVMEYLLKPIEPEELLARVAKAMDHGRLYRAVSESRERLRQTHEEFERIENLLRGRASDDLGGAVAALVDLGFRQVMRALLDLEHLTELIMSQKGQNAHAAKPDTSRPALLMQALWETVSVLEKTKSSFHSKELGQLRAKLNALLKS